MFDFNLDFERLKYDKPFLFSTGGLIIIGLIVLYSATTYIAEVKYSTPYHFILRQLIYLSLGLAVASFIYFFIDYRKLKDYAIFFVILFAILLIATKIYGDLDGNMRASRWLKVGPLRFQTSEFAKLALILYLASFYDRRTDKLEDFKTGFIPPFSVIIIISALIIIAPDFSTGAIIAFIAILMMIIAGARWKHLSVFAGLGLVGGIAVVFYSPYKLQRVLSHFNPSKDLDGAGYQLHQSLISLGNGGIFGQGLGNGVQKELFLPDCHTDFIFSVVGEELGFVFSTLILGIYLFIFWRGIKIAVNAPDKFGQLLGIGLMLSIFIYVLVNISIVCGILPVTGLPLPFMSYGGSAFLYNMMAVGLILNISKYSKDNKNYRRDYIING